MPQTKKYRIRAALDYLHEAGMDSLTGRQLRVMLSCRKDDQTVRGLAQKLGISKPAVTRAADRLTAEGFLLREVDPKDRRSVNLSLTPSGASLAAHFE
nr:MarR family transcriptional regulator [uncultured Acidocella sp.]